MDIVDMLWDGKLRQVRIDPQKCGYEAILVSDDETKVVASADSASVTLKDACKRLKATFSTVRRLVDAGLLEKIDGGPTITMQSLDLFLSKYANLKTFADEIDSHQAKVWWALKRARLEPAFPKEVAGARFYERNLIRQIS